MPHAIWKGSVTFGLVNVPVSLYPASNEDDVDFDWLDKRTMDRVGYKRINKRTGKEIDRENIVKGVKQENGKYVVLSDDEVKQAYPKTTQTIEIEAFVSAQEVPFYFLERPYYLEPVGNAEKVYALLREAMLQSSVIGIARIVMHTKEHLCALVPTASALMLDTLRWATEIRPTDELNIPAAGKAGVKLKESELKMANQLIRGMTSTWRPDGYADKFTDAIHRLVARKLKAGKAETVMPLEETSTDGTSSNVIDLTELLKNSLRKRGSVRADTIARVPRKRATKPAARARPVAAGAGRATRGSA